MFALNRHDHGFRWAKVSSAGAIQDLDFTCFEFQRFFLLSVLEKHLIAFNFCWSHDRYAFPCNGTYLQHHPEQTYPLIVSFLSQI